VSEKAREMVKQKVSRQVARWVWLLVNMMVPEMVKGKVKIRRAQVSPGPAGRPPAAARLRPVLWPRAIHAVEVYDPLGKGQTAKC
jgi:hypothetical protein